MKNTMVMVRQARIYECLYVGVIATFNTRDTTKNRNGTTSLGSSTSSCYIDAVDVSIDRTQTKTQVCYDKWLWQVPNETYGRAVETNGISVEDQRVEVVVVLFGFRLLHSIGALVRGGGGGIGVLRRWGGAAGLVARRVGFGGFGVGSVAAGVALAVEIEPVEIKLSHDGTDGSAKLGAPDENAQALTAVQTPTRGVHAR